jgi:uncharacterized membrane protein (UPF0136 family)
MNGSALVAVAYGLLMIAGGVFAYRRIGSVPSLVGGGATGGLALLGGAMMLGGSQVGRPVALAGAGLAALFFAWSLVRAVATGKKAGRPAGLLALSVAAAAVLIWAA